MPNGIAGIVHHVQHGTAQILRNDHYGWHTLLILFVQGDVEPLMIGPHGVVRQTHILLHDMAHIGWHALILLATRYEQDALYDTYGTLTVLLDLLHILLQTVHDVGEVFAVSLWQQAGIVFHDGGQVAKEPV